MTLCWPGLLRSKQRQWQSIHLISNCAEVQITFNVGCLRHDVYISTLIGSLCEVTDYSLLLFIILQTSDCIKWPVPAHTDHSLMLSSSHPHTSYCQIKLPYFYWATLIGLLGPCSLTGMTWLCTEHSSLSSPRINVIAQTSCLTTIALPAWPVQVHISTIFRSDKISWEYKFTARKEKFFFKI